ncbi:methyltransferase domain-containing protein [Salinadaptatus halalkaliphilus]|uniref:Methyltransferase domain-containing protein n=1 Tax=Salinadaptatus halalkaliphilus TaxID=2419781 RepID=A0A4S3TRI2_9EURY|nr:methyltransferase domain-containing protein [Salinadaptatus halalkaliphilus]THE65208.1 methyltransferase domain-containing protein [Salinadaptatus halalkaliphilus]
MAHTPFESRVAEYDEWFDAHQGAYRAERTALEHAVPERFDRDRALEIGVGTGRFGTHLGIARGLDPARMPLKRARERGIDPIRGVAEALPIADDALEVVLVVTVLEFVDDLEATVAECRRVLDRDGTLVVAVLDRSSPVGQLYQDHKDEDPFYAEAEFVTGEYACEILEEAGLTIERRLQTIFDAPEDLENDSMKTTEVREGHGEGLFAVIRATPNGR